MNHSRFDSKAECFSTTSLHHTLQPSTLVSFQKLCITVDLLKRERNLASPCLILWRRYFCGFVSSPPILMGLRRWAEHHTTCPVKLLVRDFHGILGLGVRGHASWTSRPIWEIRPSRKGVSRENFELVLALPLRLLWRWPCL